MLEDAARFLSGSSGAGRQLGFFLPFSFETSAAAIFLVTRSTARRDDYIGRGHILSSSLLHATASLFTTTPPLLFPLRVIACQLLFPIVPSSHTEDRSVSRAEPILTKRTIRRHQLRELVPLADTTIYEMEQRGDFPQRFYLTSRCVVWDLAEVEAWVETRRQASKAKTIIRAPVPDVRQRKTRPVKH